MIDLDIKGFFDNIPHDLMMRAVRKHAREKWVVLYIERWLKAPAQDEHGHQTPRDKGTPQGGVRPLVHVDNFEFFRAVPFQRPRPYLKPKRDRDR